MTRFRAALLVLALATCSAAQDPQAPEDATYMLTRVASGLTQPLSLATDGVNPERLYIVEKTGAVRVLEGNEVLGEAFLDLSGQVSTNSERGLLDIAFSPDYAESGLLYAHYNDPAGNSVLASFRVEGDRAVPESEVVLLTVPQPFANHNGGQLEFGPDGYLYLALGDGGSGGDPLNHGQNPSTLLGAILRLAVTADVYTVPESNPFVGTSGRAPELWAWGLRNPWRFSFDRETGDLWVADVGQNAYEEIN
jgi:glucose/arabinose dehydrogenase